MAAMAALGEMTLKAVMGALALALGPHWAVSDLEARTWGEAFEAWLKSQPAKRRKALTNALAAVPTLNLVVATGVVVAPRVRATVAMAQTKKEAASGEASKRESNANANNPGNSRQTGPSDGADYASAIAKALRGNAGSSGQGGSPNDSSVFPKA